MPTEKPKWLRRSSARPEELARSALELCAERGVQATRVADVAERAGVTVGTVYRYFKDKDALIEAAMQLAEHPTPRAVPDRPGASLPALADAIRRWGQYFSETGVRTTRVALSDPRRNASRSEGAIREATGELESILLSGIARKDIRDDLDASTVAHALIGALLLGPMLGGDNKGHVESTSALAVRGLRPDGPSWRS